MLAIARLQAAAGRAPDPAVFDAADLAADMAELYEPAGEDKGLDFSAEIERGLMIEGNQPFLAQALANIIDNAIKYTPTGGAVMLRARRRSSGEIEFSVTDTGPGVPEEDRERVIQRFVRLDNSRTEPGSGLGLSLVGGGDGGARRPHRAGRRARRYGGFGPGLRVALVLPPASGAMSQAAARANVWSALRPGRRRRGGGPRPRTSGGRRRPRRLDATCSTPPGRRWRPVFAASPYLFGLARRWPEHAAGRSLDGRPGRAARRHPARDRSP